MAQLYVNYGEQPVAIGLTGAGNLIEVLKNETGDSWTMITTSPGGLTCIVQAGTNWQRVERQDPKQGS